MASRTGAGGTTRQTLVLAVLLVVAAVSLRGYLPGAERARREPPADNPFAMYVVIGLLVAAIAVVTVAVVIRARKPSAPRGAAASRPAWLRSDVGRPTWRLALIAFGFVLAALVAAMVLSRLSGRAGLSPPAYVPPDTSQSSTPTPAPGPTDSEGPAAPRTGPDVLGYFYAATGLFLVVLVAGSIVAMRRPPGSSPTGPESDVGPQPDTSAGTESLARAAEVALAEVEQPGRDPRAAIIACYAAMEGELARVPEVVPQDFDTASEVLARAVDHHALRPDSATQLVDLFDEARFSPHVMNEGHRETAAAALQRVLAELRTRP
jgi:Domain of unknown function (DUF4129)